MNFKSANFSSHLTYFDLVLKSSLNDWLPKKTNTTKTDDSSRSVSYNKTENRIHASDVRIIKADEEVSYEPSFVRNHDEKLDALHQDQNSCSSQRNASSLSSRNSSFTNINEADLLSSEEKGEVADLLLYFSTNMSPTPTTQDQSLIFKSASSSSVTPSYLHSPSYAPENNTTKTAKTDDSPHILSHDQKSNTIDVSDVTIIQADVQVSSDRNDDIKSDSLSQDLKSCCSLRSANSLCSRNSSFTIVNEADLLCNEEDLEDADILEYFSTSMPPTPACNTPTQEESLKSADSLSASSSYHPSLASINNTISHERAEEVLNKSVDSVSIISEYFDKILNSRSCDWLTVTSSTCQAGDEVFGVVEASPAPTLPSSSRRSSFCSKYGGDSPLSDKLKETESFTCDVRLCEKRDDEKCWVQNFAMPTKHAFSPHTSTNFTFIKERELFSDLGAIIEDELHTGQSDYGLGLTCEKNSARIPPGLVNAFISKHVRDLQCETTNFPPNILSTAVQVVLKKMIHILTDRCEKDECKLFTLPKQFFRSHFCQQQNFHGRNKAEKLFCQNEEKLLQCIYLIQSMIKKNVF